MEARATRNPGRPKQNRAEPDLRANLIAAALEAFSEFGYEGASLRDIASRGGGDLGLIRYYFGNKEDLWYAAMRDLSKRLRSELERVLGDVDSSDRGGTQALEKAIRWFIDMSARYPGLSRIIVAESDRPGKRQKFISKEMVRPFFDLMSTLIERAKAEGTVPHTSTRTIFFMITHGGSFPMAIPALTNDMPGARIQSKAALREHADAVVSLVIRKGGSISLPTD